MKPLPHEDDLEKPIPQRIKEANEGKATWSLLVRIMLYLTLVFVLVMLVFDFIALFKMDAYTAWKLEWVKDSKTSYDVNVSYDGMVFVRFAHIFCNAVLIVILLLALNTLGPEPPTNPREKIFGLLFFWFFFNAIMYIVEISCYVSAINTFMRNITDYDAIKNKAFNFTNKEEGTMWTFTFGESQENSRIQADQLMMSTFWWVGVISVGICLILTLIFTFCFTKRRENIDEIRKLEREPHQPYEPLKNSPTAVNYYGAK